MERPERDLMQHRATSIPRLTAIKFWLSRLGNELSVSYSSKSHENNEYLFADFGQGENVPLEWNTWMMKETILKPYYHHL
jgi:hypothetical protein